MTKGEYISGEELFESAKARYIKKGFMKNRPITEAAETKNDVMDLMALEAGIRPEVINHMRGYGRFDAIEHRAYADHVANQGEVFRRTVNILGRGGSQRQHEMAAEQMARRLDQERASRGSPVNRPSEVFQRENPLGSVPSSPPPAAPIPKTPPKASDKEESIRASSRAALSPEQQETEMEEMQAALDVMQSKPVPKPIKAEDTGESIKASSRAALSAEQQQTEMEEMEAAKDVMESQLKSVKDRPPTPKKTKRRGKRIIALEQYEKKFGNRRGTSGKSAAKILQAISEELPFSKKK